MAWGTSRALTGSLQIRMLCRRSGRWQRPSPQCFPAQAQSQGGANRAAGRHAKLTSMLARREARYSIENLVDATNDRRRSGGSFSLKLTTSFIPFFLLASTVLQAYLGKNLAGCDYHPFCHSKKKVQKKSSRLRRESRAS